MDLNQIWQWICANPVIVAILVVGEIMPFLPTESNGVAQAFLNILKKIPTKPIAMLLVMVWLAGCQTLPTINITNSGGMADVQVPKDGQMLTSHGGVNIVIIDSNNKDVPFDVLRGLAQNANLQGNVPLQGGAVNNPAQTVTGK
jgi:hypothetical protein